MIEEKLYFFGYSGHALVAADCIPDNLELCAYFAENENLGNPLALRFMGSEKSLDLAVVIGKAYVFPALGDNTIRRKLLELFALHNLNETVLRHPSSIVSSRASIGNSSLLAPGSIINAGAHIGRGVIINSGAIVEHECHIHDCAHIAPGAILAGNVTVGEGSFIGAGSVVKEGVHIGKNVIIGAGSVVIRDIADNEKQAGNPTRRI